MIDRLRQRSEPRLRLLAEIEKSQTPIERDILGQWVRNKKYGISYCHYQNFDRFGYLLCRGSKIISKKLSSVRLFRDSWGNINSMHT